MENYKNQVEKQYKLKKDYDYTMAKARPRNGRYDIGFIDYIAGNDGGAKKRVARNTKTMHKCLELGKPGTQAVVDYEKELQEKYENLTNAYKDYAKREQKSKFMEYLLLTASGRAQIKHSIVSRYNQEAEYDVNEFGNPWRVMCGIPEDSEYELPKETKVETKESPKTEDVYEDTKGIDTEQSTMGDE